MSSSLFSKTSQRSCTTASASEATPAPSPTEPAAPESHGGNYKEKSPRPPSAAATTGATKITVADIPNKGKGVFATDSIKRGEIVVAEQPKSILPYEQSCVIQGRNKFNMAKMITDEKMLEFVDREIICRRSSGNSTRTCSTTREDGGEKQKQQQQSTLPGEEQHDHDHDRKPTLQEKILQLSDFGKSVGVPAKRYEESVSVRLSAKFWSNAVPGPSCYRVVADENGHHSQVQEEEDMALCTEIVPRFNHSCRPNAVYTWHYDQEGAAPTSGNVSSSSDAVDDEAGGAKILAEPSRSAVNGKVVIVAIRDIEPEEEICICYMDVDIMESDRKTRLQWCQQTMGFTCQCEVCSNPSGKNGIGSSRALGDRRDMCSPGTTAKNNTEGKSCSEAARKRTKQNANWDDFLEQSDEIQGKIDYFMEAGVEAEFFQKMPASKRKKIVQDTLEKKFKLLEDCNFFLPCNMRIFGYEGYCLSVLFDFPKEEKQKYAEIRSLAHAQMSGRDAEWKMLSLAEINPAKDTVALAQGQELLKQVKLQQREKMFRKMDVEMVRLAGKFLVGDAEGR
ncbi:unnamed protein product [Amoebophrya sp. A120]|nr:unnamed protein product [Amoebophrya sp. A120]|eukprot:GSA120T00001210001.1